MNQNNTLTPELVEAIRTVLDYLWEAERNDYEANPRPDHMFLALRTLAEIGEPVEKRNAPGSQEIAFHDVAFIADWF